MNKNELPEVTGLISGMQMLLWRTGDHGELCDGAVTLPNPSDIVADATKVDLWYIGGHFLLDIFCGSSNKPMTVDFGSEIPIE